VRRACAFLALAVAAALVAGCAAEIAPTAQPPRGFDASLVKRGAELAAVGDCAGCHTRSGGRPFAGGVPLETPFGTIFGTNITPDVAYGIGAWSEEAFRRAMREGVARSGRELYPAFPYDHFTRLADEDIEALYAFLMTREPVAEPPRANRLGFPFNLRPLVAGWKLLYFKPARFQPDSSKSAEWNRGAYLVEGLGHCGACHTPRNRLGAEEKGRRLAGGMIEGWYAPALNEASPSPIPWTRERLAEYLAKGIAERHAMAAGPMQAVTQQLGRASSADVKAIATYIESAMGPATPEREARAKAALELALRGQAAAAGASESDATLALGRALYVGACAGCHEGGRRVSSNGALELPLAVALYDPEPASLINIIRGGIRPPPGEPGRWMPAFAGAFTKPQLDALVSYLHTLAPGAPPWRHPG
jgi:mono/diheme cytochrome c family protein